MSIPISVDDDWRVLLQFVPQSWRRLARETGALRRARGFSDEECLFRALLIHLAEGCSLREVSARLRARGLADVSDVALWKRLREAGEWFRQLGVELLDRKLGHRNLKLWCKGRRVRLIDATIISEPGSTGTDWRVHYGLNLETLECDAFELTDVKGGESFRRFEIRRGDLVLGDRVYSQPPGVRHVRLGGGDVIVRLRVNGASLRNAAGRTFPLLSRLRRLRMGQIGDWTAKYCSKDGSEAIPVRICAVRKTAEAKRRTLAKIRVAAKKKKKVVSKAREEGTGFIFVLTTLSRKEMSSESVLELYRARWQVELAFKRMKSIIGLGHLPKKDEKSARAWIHGKLFVALLADNLIQASKSLSPWGYSMQELRLQESRATIDLARN